MTRIAAHLATLFLLTVAIATSLPAQARRPIKMLPPSAFPELPKTVVAELSAKKCRIPQEWTGTNTKPNNVVRGSFATAKQQDWAVLCSRGGQSSIVFVWGGPVKCASEISKARDEDYMVSIGEGVVFVRSISSLRATEARASARDAGVRNAGALQHSAIMDSTEKSTSAMLCSRGQWVDITSESET